ncbi:hypothetical protein ABEB36_008584 [Hypothenemus hampei]|uniref:Uncharacterized protein n=1 Tax=Hypothenemus hampei TaxID=57062 RepID=A0ABD1EMT9_HYPHA
MSLSEAQLKFIEECKQEFSERFTDLDCDYKKIYDEGIPSPPIIYPWHPRNRNNRDWGPDRSRQGGGRNRHLMQQRHEPHRSNDRRYRPY